MPRPLTLVLASLFTALPASAMRAVHGEASRPPLCDDSIVQATCLVLNGGHKHSAGDDWVSSDVIGDLLRINASQMLAVWKEMALSGSFAFWASGTGGVSIRCSSLCGAVIGYVARAGVLPPSSDVACYTLGASSHCDVAVGPADLAGLGPGRDADMPDFHDSAYLEEGANASAGAAPALLEEEASTTIAADYNLWEVVERMANFFRIYPAERPAPGRPGALLETVSSGNDWCDGCELKNKRKETMAKAYLGSAIRAFNGRKTQRQLTKWYGPNCFHLDDCRQNILRIMKSVSHMLSHVDYVYPGPKCGKQTYAYVHSRGYRSCLTQRLRDNPCATTSDGKYVIYLCPLYFARASEMVEVLVHEGSHHATAYTKDVEYNGRKAYGRDACWNLGWTDQSKALQNADNFCYYIQDVEDQVNSDSMGDRANQLCHHSAVTRRPDSDGDCSCPTDKACTDDGRSCPWSEGGPGSTRYFVHSCTTCLCTDTDGGQGTPGGRAGASGSATPHTRTTTTATTTTTTTTAATTTTRTTTTTITPTAATTILVAVPAMYGRIINPAAVSTTRATTYAHQPALPTTSNRPPGTCPPSARSSKPDADGDCKCRIGTRCLNDGQKGCPWSRGDRSRFTFFQSCVACACHNER